ncbi:MAG: hypothetical protein COW24_04130 [Candidatus Kerfeldbacteria bacterium CG15_BIG_FIL_POST_REV_8_21_14_020_45_12]|uniref:GRAM domain-containing protein n=1 Tax=Candidatus Kerfeldbacteria bacterium CG15_BIG_FIL_POST_REV_8_21_14_020_45_12 TaxID=2014247 RepID=A0A2M7H3E5_9BACT|nr:MAG: hypothetical protein COW24_04130 [Candidatus Kerfeldbacteria bacterium CG15_BIG_FIL_POST_REV_8_21_14_020_45_12]PJA93126.1 MAG: hypothetical protein CO132_04465 [Candidatus Kerfeldbacteria bacterium CG_4_9_14_3_um_filter_45_8]
MKIELLDNEKIIKEGMATRYSGNRLLWTGALYLTNQRISFVTHPLNFQRYSITVPLEQISTVELVYNYRIFPHGFRLNLHTGENLHFSGWNRKLWIKTIRQAITKKSTAA